MNYVKSFDLFGVPAKQIPSITESGAPTTETEGAVGCLYMDTDTGNLYKCTAVVDGEYTWVEAGNGSSSVSGGGLSTASINLLIDILKVGMFTANVSGKIESLKEALLAGSSGDSGGSGGGEETVADEITFADGMLTIVSVGSDVSVANGVMTIL